jgi:hypothetical protein
MLSANEILDEKEELIDEGTPRLYFSNPALTEIAFYIDLSPHSVDAVLFLKSSNIF